VPAEAEVYEGRIEGLDWCFRVVHSEESTLQVMGKQIQHCFSPPCINEDASITKGADGEMVLEVKLSWATLNYAYKAMGNRFVGKLTNDVNSKQRDIWMIQVTDPSELQAAGVSN